jgi:peroxiredoxin Q/BCP
VTNKDLEGRNAVLFFYPKDSSPVCSVEACAFRDAYEEFLNYGCEVIGISSDDEISHKRFAGSNNLPFRLLSDPGNQIRKKFGVPADLFGLIPGRVTYLIDREGMVKYKFNSQLNAGRHVKEALHYLSVTSNKIRGKKQL